MTPNHGPEEIPPLQRKQRGYTATRRVRLNSREKHYIAYLLGVDEWPGMGLTEPEHEQLALKLRPWLGLETTPKPSYYMKLRPRGIAQTPHKGHKNDESKSPNGKTRKNI